MITTLFLDVGGVILTNGWDHNQRHLAAEAFSLDQVEMEKRHGALVDPYERDTLSLDDYLRYVVFYEKRDFSKADFIEFMYQQSRPYQEMIDWLIAIKKQYKLKLIALSNEARDVMNYRIKTYEMREWIDFFIVSCFVGMRKPDPQIYQLALDISQTDPSKIFYLDDRPLFVEIAKNFGIKGITHTNLENTKSVLLPLLNTK